MPAPFAPRPQDLPLPPAPLAGLRVIEESSRQMLAAAQAAQWAQFRQLALQCKQQVQAERDAAKEVAQAAGAQHHAGVFSPGFGNEKQAILLRILQNDALIRVLTEPAAGVRATAAQAFGAVSAQLH